MNPALFKAERVSRHLGIHKPRRIFNCADLGRQKPVQLVRPSVVCVITGGDHGNGTRKIFDHLCRGSNMEHVEQESIEAARAWYEETISSTPGFAPMIILPLPGKGFRPIALTQYGAPIFIKHQLQFADWMVCVGSDPTTRYGQCASLVNTWFSRCVTPSVVGHGKKSQLVLPWGLSEVGDSLIGS
ncbi:MAG: hypothetical protein FGM57_03505 [Candidatus Taylorbacteria bacterium]|nr:hypothetical protein [Candidatus Taylorbacteria bacterium]